MPIPRLGFAAISDPAKQETAVEYFSNLKYTHLKGGKPYIVSAKAAKCKTVRDWSGGNKWTFAVYIVFENDDDTQYFEETASKQGDASGRDFVVVVAQFLNITIQYE
ncbi:hypothetical protein F5Y16DRAFT_397004 [Xylariaceae sp. FL0255]|nr:hypothetical protein F5Y16DRAFT_397004 [Xylariaceae sp. FL0255]